MTFRAICVAVLLSSLPVVGCGTAANLVRSNPETGGRSPFGGVRQDVSCIQQAASGELGSKTHPKSESEQYPQRALMLFCAADLPFSFFADILTWPYTVSYTFINQPIPIPPLTTANPPATQALPTLPLTQPMPLPTLPLTQPMPIPIPPVPQAPAEVRPQASLPPLLPKPWELP
jgi:hypothetical protein